MAFPENVFVLCTGRCGSTTLARACGHLTNWTAAHESRTPLLGADRLAYPARHIEIDNRLSWLLGRLDTVWGDRAAYVHLTRDPAAVARSFAARARQGILRAYGRDILMPHRKWTPARPPIALAADYVETVTRNIEHFLRGKTHVARIALETIGPDFDLFCTWIGAEGDLTAARAELSVRHNATEAAT